MVLTHHHPHFPMSTACLLSVGNFSQRKVYLIREVKMQKQEKQSNRIKQ